MRLTAGVALAVYTVDFHYLFLSFFPKCLGYNSSLRCLNLPSVFMPVSLNVSNIESERTVHGAG